MTPYRNKKTGNRYLRLATGIDTTDGRIGLRVVIYCPENDNTIHVRELNEFDREVEPVVKTKEE